MFLKTILDETTVKFGVNIFKSLLCSPRLHLFD